MKKISTQHKIALVILLLAMIASTFIGVPLNGGDKGWIYVFTMEWELIQSYTSSTSRVFMPWQTLIPTILQCIIHAALFALPFLIGRKIFFGWLVIVPLLYLMLQFITFYYLIILLVPFIVIWIATILIWKFKITTA